MDLLFDSTLFSLFLCDGKFISFHLYWLIKCLIFDILFGLPLICLWLNVTATAYWKHLQSLFFGFIVAFLFFNHSGESTYDPPQLRRVLLRW